MQYIDRHMNKPDYLEYEDRLKSLLLEFRQILPIGGAMGHTDLIKHKIILKPDAKPKHMPCYRIPKARRQAASDAIDDLVKKGVVSENTTGSDYSWPIILIPKAKKSNKPDEPTRYRLVTDMRGLNEMTLSDPYPISSIKDIMTDIKPGLDFLSSIDFESGFFQIELDEEARKYCSFVNDRKLWSYNRMVQGLKNAPATFHRLVTRVFQGLDKDVVTNFMDDLFTGAKDVETHFENLR